MAIITATRASGCFIISEVNPKKTAPITIAIEPKTPIQFSLIKLGISK